MKNYLFIIGFCLLPWLAHGEVYQWVDEKGRVHFGNVPPEQQDKYQTGRIKLQATPKPPTEKPSKKAVAPEKKSTASTASQPMNSAISDTPEKKVENVSASRVKKIGEVGAEKKPVPKYKNTKFDNRKELKLLIKNLREDVRSTAKKDISPAAKEKNSSPKKVQVSKPTPALDAKKKVTKEKIVKEKAVEKKEPKEMIVKKNALNAPVKDEKAANAQPGPEVLSQPTSGEKISADTNEKDADKCGVFSGFVNAYETKVAEECPGAHCSVYKRSLKKYKLKQERYC